MKKPSDQIRRELSDVLQLMTADSVLGVTTCELRVLCERDGRARGDYYATRLEEIAHMVLKACRGRPGDKLVFEGVPELTVRDLHQLAVEEISVCPMCWTSRWQNPVCPTCQEARDGK